MAARHSKRPAIDHVATNEAGLEAAVRALRQHLSTMLRYHPHFHGSVSLNIRLLDGAIERHIVGHEQSERNEPITLNKH